MATEKNSEGVTAKNAKQKKKQNEGEKNEHIYCSNLFNCSNFLCVQCV